MDSFPYADIVILALVAGFILLRLRGVLGQKDGNDTPQFFKRDQENKDTAKEPIVLLGGKSSKAKPADEADTYLYTLKDDQIAATIADIKKLDPSFSATGFLAGARIAYEMVFDAFAKGDRNTLEMLLDKPIYDTFVNEIEAREKSAEKTEITLVSAKAREIAQAGLSGNIARLAVQFDSEQVSLVKNAAGEIIQGNASDLHIMDDEWVFERDVTSKSPNWKIIET
jgi:predicted lipid-binding transport protein (Tim44 family)